MRWLSHRFRMWWWRVRTGDERVLAIALEWAKLKTSGARIRCIVNLCESGDLSKREARRILNGEVI